MPQPGQCGLRPRGLGPGSVALLASLSRRMSANDSQRPQRPFRIAVLGRGRPCNRYGERVPSPDSTERNRIAAIPKVEDLVTIKAALLKTGIVALGIGLGLGVAALAAIVYSQMPKGWDKKAITASFDSAEFSPTPAPAVYYTYTLSNNTDKDFSTKLLGEKHLADNLRAAAKRGPVYDDVASIPRSAPAPTLRFGDINLYTSEPNGDASIDNLANGEPIFVPARQRVQVVVRWELPESEFPKHTSVSIVNTSLFGFVVYDDTTKYQIEFPKPPLLQGKMTELDVSPAPVLGGFAPDIGTQYEKYAACEESQRLEPLCRKGNIATADGVAARDGWTPVGPLPRLPLPPMGAILEPGVETCKAVYQWDYYCRKQWTK